jgi:DNA-binding IclR family transcriptional regulator
MTSTQAEDEDKGRRAVQSVEVGGRLLLALAAHGAPMTLKDLAAHAQLPPSRAHPYLVSFSKLRLVDQEPASGRYLLGPAALQLGLAALHQLDAVRSATPVAEALARETGHAVALAVWGNFGPTVIRMIDANEPLYVAMRAGTVMSILGTATGRAFAAHLGRERLERATLGLPGLASGARRAEAIEPRELRAVVAEMRRHGVARAVGQPIPGVNAFSAAAFDHEGQPAIVLTALGHEERFPATWNSPVARQVREAAAAVSRHLGWNGAPPAPLAGTERR